jgi:transcriptional regulator with XRE-family HTH domain
MDPAAVANVKRESETVGERLRRLRTEAGLSQRAIAGPGVSAAYVCRIEKGDRTPSVKALRVMAPKLGVSAEYLETGAEQPGLDALDLELSQAELELRLAEDLDATEKKFRALLREARAAGDEASETRVQIGLGLIAHHRGEHAEAIRRLETAAKAPLVSPLTHPDVFATLGHAYVVADRGEQAAELFRNCLEQVSRDAATPADRSAYIRFATYLSMTLADLGDLEGARAAVADALVHADDPGDSYTRVRLYWSQARLAAMDGEFLAAKRNMGRAIALLEATEDRLHLARAHLLNAEILLAAGETDEAGEQLALSESLFDGNEDAQERAWFLVEKGRWEARSGQGEQAVEHATDALALVDEDPALEGRALWTLAEGLAAEGKVDQALDVIADAAKLLRSETRYSTEVLRAQAALLEQAGRVDDALATMKTVANLLQR